ncbi:Mgm1-like protein [Tribonema minus]|uniref:Mgm1-like protein n=1 Tax=Tribonema minus TaxID=303371 RepID=A0A836CBT5_9STRA|nr:Mgm1-like protein [Tribonema minus]
MAATEQNGEPLDGEAAGTQINKLDEAIERDVRPFLDLIDTLRSHGVQEETPLPQIAVMGDQSSGKSSVLEALSGISFPRGSGLVTRCPVQLVMKRARAGEAWRASARVAWSNSARAQPPAAGAVASPEALADVIAQLMAAACDATANGFSTDSLVVEVRAPECPDLTLVDLPGIVRTAVAGQSDAVIPEVSALIDAYLRQERTIILAIVPANQDVATVDILERAARVDPSGERTIGVLTKPDLIGPGNEDEVIAVLSNRRKPLRLGYVAVRCRTQRELAAGVTLRAAHAVERAFFAGHPAFAALDPALLGIESLTRRCVGVLTTRIRAALPFMKWELQEARAAAEAELRPLERGAAPRAAPERLRALMQVTGDFARALRCSVRGEYRDAPLSEAPELRVRARVDAAFRALQGGVAAMDPGFELPEFTKTLQDEIRAHRGRELCGMVNSQFFYIFMLQQVERFRPAVEACRSEIYASVLGVGRGLAQAIAPQYPLLVETMQSLVEQTVEEATEALLPELDMVFDKERNPFTENQDLVEAINRVRFERFDRVMQQVLLEAGDAPPPAEKGAPKGSELNSLHDWVSFNLGQWYRYSHGANPTSKVEDMSAILQAYWRVTSKRVCDNACMLLEASFLAAVPDALEAALLSHAQTLDARALAAALQEDAAIVERRALLESRRDRVAAALDRIAAVAPDVVATSRRQEGEDGAGGARDLSPVGGGAATPVAAARAAAAASFGADPVAPKSEPEQRAAAANDGSVAHFVYKGDGDNGGLVYWLGTAKHTRRFQNPHDRGLLSITSSGMAVGTESTLVSRRRVPCATASARDSWVCLDVGARRGVAPTHLSLCNGAAEAGSDLVNWAAEGYDDAIRMWVVLRRAAGPAALPSPHGVATWRLDEAAAGGAAGRGYRFLRLRSTGPNGRTGLGLPVCALEVYGRLFSQADVY